MDEKLRYYEQQWNIANDKAKEAKRLLEEAVRERDEARRNAAIFEKALERVKAQRNELIEAATKTETERTRQEQHLSYLRELRELAKRPGFWLDEVVAPFARELEMFDLVPHVARQTDAGDPTDMAIEAADSLAQLAQEFDEERAAYVRRLLLAQWVYLRWLELTTATGTSDKHVAH